MGSDAAAIHSSANTKNTAMKIGIIGTGNIGGTLTRRFRAVGHDVNVANSRGPASLAGLALETGAHAASVEEVARGKDVVVVAIPLKQVEGLPPSLFAKAPAKMVVIDTNNYYPQQRDGRLDGIEAGLTESGWVEQRLGHPVVKAFNMIVAPHLLEDGKPAGTVGRITLAVAGDEPKKVTVMGLVNEIGFDTVDAGRIEEAWRQQPGSPGYCMDYNAEGVRQALAATPEERAPEWRAAPNSPGTYALPA